MKLCPACYSSRVTRNEAGDRKCQNCGWISKVYRAKPGDEKGG